MIFILLIVLGLWTFSVNGQGEECTLPMQVGRCRGLIRRFYFNNVSQKCEAFNWGGCGGNGNNFRSIEECRSSCGSKKLKRSCIH